MIVGEACHGSRGLVQEIQMYRALYHNQFTLSYLLLLQVNEYSSLKDGILYSWGELDPGPFFLRLGGLWLGAFTSLGVPIAAASFNPSRVRSN